MEKNDFSLRYSKSHDVFGLTPKTSRKFNDNN